MPNVGFTLFMLQKFKSLVECAPTLYEIEGRAVRILKLAFDITHANYVADWTSAREIAISVGNKRKKYAEFEDNEFKVVKIFNKERPKFFENKVVIPVDNIKTLPLKYNKIPAVKFDTNLKRYVADECAFVNCQITAIGYSMTKEIEREERFRKECAICKSMEHLKIACPQRPPTKCFICGEVGHLQNECRFFRPRRPRIFTCRKCGSTTGGCSTEVCANFDRVSNGNLLDRFERHSVDGRSSTRQSIDDAEVNRRIRALTSERNLRVLEALILDLYLNSHL